MDPYWGILFFEPGEFSLLPHCEFPQESNWGHRKAFGLACSSGKMRGGRQEASLLNLNHSQGRQKWPSISQDA